MDGKAVLVCDQNTGSYIIAVDLSSGKTVWKQLRPEAKSGHSTPIIWRNQAGEDESLVPGSFQLSSYSPLSGERLWWVGGLSFEMKSTPVIAGDVLFIPAGVAHGFSEITEPITYIVYRIDPDQVVTLKER